MKQILDCGLLPKWEMLEGLAHSALSTESCKNNFRKAMYSCNKSFIVITSSVKMTGYWPHLFLGVYGTRSALGHKHVKKELGQYPAI